MSDHGRVRVAAVCLLLLCGPIAWAQAPPSNLIDRLRAGDRAGSLRLIAQGADVNAAEADGATPLHLAAEREDRDVVRALLERGANPQAPNRYGVTPLSVAAATGNAAVLTLLLDAGADPNTTAAEAETALMAAARTGRVEAITLLLNRGAQVNAHETWRNQT